MTTDLISITNSLKNSNLNYDFKISKNDILDIMIEQLRENLEEEIRVLKEDYDNFMIEYNKFSDEYDDKQLQSLQQDPKVQALIKATEEFYGKSYEITCENRAYYLVPTKHEFTCYNNYLDIKKYVSYDSTDEGKEKYKLLTEKKDNYNNVRQKLVEFNSNSNRMRVAVLKQFLAGTEEGSKLLDLINKSRTGKQLIKAINKTDNQ